MPKRGSKEMSDDSFKTELAALLEKHGSAGLAARPRAPAVANPGGLAASYIKEIITGAEAFDEQTLERVVKVLRPTNR